MKKSVFNGLSFFLIFGMSRFFISK